VTQNITCCSFSYI